MLTVFMLMLWFLLFYYYYLVSLESLTGLGTLTPLRNLYFLYLSRYLVIWSLSLGIVTPDSCSEISVMFLY